MLWNTEMDTPNCLGFSGKASQGWQNFVWLLEDGENLIRKGTSRGMGQRGVLYSKYCGIECFLPTPFLPTLFLPTPFPLLALFSSRCMCSVYIYYKCSLVPIGRDEVCYLTMGIHLSACTQHLDCLGGSFPSQECWWIRIHPSSLWNPAVWPQTCNTAMAERRFDWGSG